MLGWNGDFCFVLHLLKIKKKCVNITYSLIGIHCGNTVQQNG